MKPTPHSDRIFIGTYSTGISFADRMREKNGDYAPLAFLSFDTLHLRMERDCPTGLAPAIEAYASTIQAQRGKPFKISAAGQAVILGTSASNN